MKELKKIIARTLCFMHQRIFRPIYIFNNYAYFLDFRAQKFPLIHFNLNPFYHQQALHLGVSNYEKQHKEGTCKVLGRSVVFSAFYADFCFCSKLVIITTLTNLTFESNSSICHCSKEFFFFVRGWGGGGGEEREGKPAGICSGFIQKGKNKIS